MSNDYFKAQGWFKTYALNSQDSRGVFQQLVKEDEEAFRLASAETDRIKDMINEKFGPGTMKPASELPPVQNPFDDFEDRNPMAGIEDETREYYLKYLEDRPEGSKGKPIPLKDFAPEFIRENAADGGRMNFDNGGGADKYITPSRRSGAEGFQGQKFISVKDPSYSDGRKRVKTPEYEKYLKEEIKKSKQRPDAYAKGNTRRQPGLLRIAEAMQQADIYDNPEYMMPNEEAMKVREKDFGRKQKIYKNGMLQAGDIVYINGLEKNFDDVIFIANQLGEDPDWVLDQLDERINFRDFEKDKKDVYKKDPKYTKPRNDYLKVENWVQRNAKKYANPDAFENALIKRFSKDNQFVKDMNSNKGKVTSYFSDDFKKMMFNADPRTQIIPSHLKQFIKSSLYNFNPKIKNAVTEEIKGIFNSENLPKLRLEARNLLNNNKLLTKFGINKAITGPFAKVIQAEIGTDMWNDITNFRNPRVGTSEMLSTLKNLVDPEFKPMFEETIKAINFSKKNQWQKAKDVFGLADDIMWDHKVPSSIIDKGYADRIESIKVNPTSKDFNARIKNAGFDRPINKLITKFEKATTLDAKAKIKNEMDIVKNNFSKKYGGYLDEISIDLDKKGNLKFSSSANPLTTKDDRVKMLGKSIIQEGALDQKKLKEIEAYITDTTGKVKMPKFSSQSGFIDTDLLGGEQLKKIFNSEGFKTFKANIANPALKSAMVAAKLPTKIFGGLDLVLGYLDYSNNRQKGFSKTDATKHMVDAVLFGATSFGKKADIAGVREIANKNGMSNEVFDNLMALNLNQKKMMDTINKSKAKFNESMDIIESGASDPTAEKMLIQKLKKDTKPVLAETMRKIVDDSRSLNTNLQVQEAGAPININVDNQKAYKDLGTASRKFVQNRIDASDLENIANQKDSTKGIIGDATMSGLKAMYTQPKFIYDLINPLSPLPKPKDFFPKDLNYKDQMKQLKKEDPTMYYKMLMSEGIDPRINLNIPVQLEFERNRPEFGSQLSDGLTQNKAEGGIIGLRSKYEYKK